MGEPTSLECSAAYCPPSIPDYVRDNSGPIRQLANAAWWFSRGKPRHLSKAIDALRAYMHRAPDSADVVLLIRDGLDKVGQEPSAVPPADLAPRTRGVSTFAVAQ